MKRLNPSSSEYRELVNKLTNTKIGLPLLNISNKFLTGTKDVDRIILSNLDDVDLFKICVPPKNRYTRDLCNENFWRNRLVAKFPGTVNYKPDNKSWKKYYLYVVYYTEKLKIYSGTITFKTGDPKIYYNLIEELFASSYGGDLDRIMEDATDILNESAELGYKDLFNAIYNTYLRIIQVAPKSTDELNEIYEKWKRK